MKFIESILYRDGFYENLELHQSRMQQVFDHFDVPSHSYDLKKILPELTLTETYKVRLIYDASDPEASYDLEYAEYVPRRIKSLEVIESEKFDYSMKYENRSKINALAGQSNADDIIISIDNHITDGSYFNLAFWDGENWLTPNTPLLNGIRRTQLINDGRIQESEIRTYDLDSFEKVSLINAMLDLGELEVSIDQIKF